MSIIKEIERQYGEFTAIRNGISAESIGTFASSSYKKKRLLFKNQNYKKNVEWIGRHYLASKKISLAALYFTQAEALLDQGMKNLSFYSLYYSLFNALSSNFLLDSDFSLRKARKISHSALSRDVQNYYISREIYKDELILLLSELRFCRELYSYHLPISGRVIGKSEPLEADRLFEQLKKLLPICLQISELQSYISYFAWMTEVGHPIDAYEEHRDEVDNFFWSIVSYKGPSGLEHVDDGDYSLLSYFIKSGLPMPITWLINEKVLEDIECSWEEEETELGYKISSVSSYITKVTGAI